MGQQLLPKLLKCLESASPGINFCPVFLPRGGKGLGNRQKMLTLMSTISSQQRVMGAGGTMRSSRPSRATKFLLLSRQVCLPTWCRSSKASAPVTSLASSSEDTNPRIPLIQDMRSLETRSTEEQSLRYWASRLAAQEKRTSNSCLRRLFGVNPVNLPNGARSLSKVISKLLVHLFDIF